MKLLNGGWLGITASRDYPISPVDVISQHRSAEHQYAPAAGKSFAIGSNEGAGSLRCLPRVGAVGDGWMGLSFEFHLPEIRPLVPFVRQTSLWTKYELIIHVPPICTTIFPYDASFSVENHDVVTTRE